MTALRAEILVDRFFWRLEQPEPAGDAVAALASEDRTYAGFLDAQLAYTRLVFDRDAVPDDRARAYAGFAEATADGRFTGWATFWLGALAEHVDRDPRAAGRAYERAIAYGSGDAMLESYAIRHQAALDREAGVRLLRRSYHLRAALGARPQTAAAAATLADELPPGPEADDLRETAALTARELRLTWLLAAL